MKTTASVTRRNRLMTGIATLLLAGGLAACGDAATAVPAPTATIATVATKAPTTAAATTAAATTAAATTAPATTAAATTAAATTAAATTAPAATTAAPTTNGSIPLYPGLTAASLGSAFDQSFQQSFEASSGGVKLDPSAYKTYLSHDDSTKIVAFYTKALPGAQVSTQNIGGASVNAITQASGTVITSVTVLGPLDAATLAELPAGAQGMAKAGDSIVVTYHVDVAGMGGGSTAAATTAAATTAPATTAAPAATTAATNATAAPSTSASGVKVVKANVNQGGFTIDSYTVVKGVTGILYFYGVAKNTTDKPLTFDTFKVTLADAAGTELESPDALDNLNVVPAGATTPFSILIDKGRDYKTATWTIKTSPYDAATGIFGTSDTLTIDKLVVKKDSLGYTLTGTVTNDGKAKVNTMVVTAGALDKDGVLLDVEGAVPTKTELAPGETSDFSISFLYVPDSVTLDDIKAGVVAEGLLAT